MSSKKLNLMLSTKKISNNFQDNKIEKMTNFRKINLIQDEIKSICKEMSNSINSNFRFFSPEKKKKNVFHTKIKSKSIDNCEVFTLSKDYKNNFFKENDKNNNEDSLIVMGKYSPYFNDLKVDKIDIEKNLDINLDGNFSKEFENNKINENDINLSDITKNLFNNKHENLNSISSLKISECYKNNVNNSSINENSFINISEQIDNQKELKYNRFDDYEKSKRKKKFLNDNNYYDNISYKNNKTHENVQIIFENDKFNNSHKKRYSKKEKENISPININIKDNFKRIDLKKNKYFDSMNFQHFSSIFDNNVSFSEIMKKYDNKKSYSNLGKQLNEDIKIIKKKNENTQSEIIKIFQEFIIKINTAKKNKDNFEEDSKKKLNDILLSQIKDFSQIYTLMKNKNYFFSKQKHRTIILKFQKKMEKEENMNFNKLKNKLKKIKEKYEDPINLRSFQNYSFFLKYGNNTKFLEGNNNNFDAKFDINKNKIINLEIDYICEINKIKEEYENIFLKEEKKIESECDLLVKKINFKFENFENFSVISNEDEKLNEKYLNVDNNFDEIYCNYFENNIKFSNSDRNKRNNTYKDPNINLEKLGFSYFTSDGLLKDFSKKSVKMNYKNENNKDNIYEIILTENEEKNPMKISKEFPMSKINYLSNFSTNYYSNENENALRSNNLDNLKKDSLDTLLSIPDEEIPTKNHERDFRLKTLKEINKILKE